MATSDRRYQSSRDRHLSFHTLTISYIAHPRISTTSTTLIRFSSHIDLPHTLHKQQTQPQPSCHAAISSSASSRSSSHPSQVSQSTPQGRLALSDSYTNIASHSLDQIRSLHRRLPNQCPPLHARLPARPNPRLVYHSQES